jgi:hypothetical protein
MESHERTPDPAREAQPGAVPRDEELPSEKEQRHQGEPDPAGGDAAADHTQPPDDPRDIQGGL